MMNFTPSHNAKSHSETVQNYYKLHSRIYDLSRWTFLFGRNEILKKIPSLPSQPHILEIGCGTGRNIKRLHSQFPDAKITGLDLSADMLKIAEKRLKESVRVKFINADFFSKELNLNSYDLILLSYSLTMFGDQAHDAIVCISKNLKPKGYLAVVDFNTSPLRWFRQWMGINHVDFSGEFLPQLQNKFHSVETEVNKAYLGLWNYFLFVGQWK